MVEDDRHYGDLTDVSARHLYVHVPYCARKCPYCDFNSIADRTGEYAEYVDALLREIAQLPSGPYKTIFMGGGTPTELPPAVLQRLVCGIADHVELCADYEWTCEANPGSADAERFAVLAQAGVNRLSIGVQSIQDHHLQFLGRIHNAAEADRVVRLAQDLMPRVSADVIIGLPRQTVAEVSDTISWLGERQLDHASVYHLAIEPGTEFHARHARGDLKQISQERSRVMLDTAWSALESIGLSAYETSNFARPGYECLHNLAYWRQRNYHAAGAGAVSTINGCRMTRQPHSGRYIRAVNQWSACMDARTGDHVVSAELPGDEPTPLIWRTEHLSVETVLIEAWMLGLRLCEGVSLAAIEQLGDSEQRWRPLVAQTNAEGLTEQVAGYVRLTVAGRAVQDAVTVRLMPAVDGD